MLRDSLDALRGVLISAFPNVDTIYIKNVPEKFERPSFLVDLVSQAEEHINKRYYQLQATWQIVYFAPEDKVKNPDKLDQYSVSDALTTKLMEGMVVSGPGGTIYRILDCSGGPRNEEVYLTVRLETHAARPEPEHDLMQDVDHVFKEE
jgi:hypothetical protein